MFIDPEISAALEEFPLDLGGLDDAQLPMIREALAATPAAELSGAVERTDHTVPASGEAPELTLRVHRPVASKPTRGCLVWMHGGGLILGSADMDDARFDKWCADRDLVAVSVDYRLAPETPFPGPIDDCYRALGWVHEHAQELGVDPAAIGVGGVSAGGGLAAALALMARDRGELPVAYQLLIYPMLDDRQITDSSQWDAPVWPAAANTYGWGCYLGAEKGTAEVPPYAAAARATELGELPPTLITVGSADGFLDENVDYALRLNAAGVPTELHVYPGATHGFELIAPDSSVSRRAARDIEDWLARR